MYNGLCGGINAFDVSLDKAAKDRGDLGNQGTPQKRYSNGPLKGLWS
jgi:hypothetical protein